MEVLRHSAAEPQPRLEIGRSEILWEAISARINPKF